MITEATLDARFSSPEASPTPWAAGIEQLEGAEIYWISTVKSNGQPHVTPMIAIWLEDSLYFATGPEEQKARNLVANPRCTITTGCNSIQDGLDVVIEGSVSREIDAARLQQLADRYKSKYDWNFTASDGALFNEIGGEALVFRVDPVKAFGFAKGATFGQTRWTF